MSRLIALLFPLFLLLSGCLSKHQPVQAPRSTTVAVASALAVLDSTEVQAVPDALAEGIAQLCSERNLQPTALAPAAYTGEFASKRTSQHRLEHVAAQAGGAELLLLVETTVAYYSQMNGRYRWTVEVDATISPADDLSQAFAARFSVPVFLEHYHEKEAAALEAAAPLLERRLGALLDAYLGGL
jgi:fructose-specific component phosphotransferase system IIB-like protein